jgi:predicted transcriptional regulator
MKFSVTDELRDEVRRAARREQRSESAIVRRALYSYLGVSRPELRPIGDVLADALELERARTPESF